MNQKQVKALRQESIKACIALPWVQYTEEYKQDSQGHHIGTTIKMGPCVRKDLKERKRKYKLAMRRN